MATACFIPTKGRKRRDAMVSDSFPSKSKMARVLLPLGDRLYRFKTYLPALFYTTARLSGVEGVVDPVIMIAIGITIH